MRIVDRFGALFRLGRRAYYPYRVQILILGLLSFLGGFFEGIGITAVIPLLTFMLNSSEQANDAISKAIRAMFNFIHIDFAPKFLLIFIVVLFFARSGAILLITYIKLQINSDYEATSRGRVLRAALRASWPYLLKEKAGQLETLLMTDVPASAGLLQKITDSVTLGTSLCIYLAIAFNISSTITILTLVLGAVFFVLMKPITWRMRVLSRARSEGYENINHFANQHMGGIKTIKALSAEELSFAMGKRSFDHIKALSVQLMFLYQVSVVTIPSLGILYIALIFGTAYRTHFLALAALPAIVYLIYRIVSYFQMMQATIQDVNVLIPHLQRVVAYEENAERHREDLGVGTRGFSFTDALRFNDVSFSYLTEEEVIRNASFTIPKGAVVGIIGPSGSGKTTCVDLMLRLLNPATGVVTLDGIDAREITLSSWRHSVSYVSQDFFLTRGTIRENIRFYDEHMTDEDVWAAAHMANIDEFIRSNPKGLDTMVGDRGVTLSAGQRQRIVIARALARKPSLLILDEATSALDNESEAHLQQVIRSLKGKVTIVVIAHRLSTIMDADILVALENGSVAETGSPQELLRDKNSYFHKVYSIHH